MSEFYSPFNQNIVLKITAKREANEKERNVKKIARTKYLCVNVKETQKGKLSQKVSSCKHSLCKRLILDNYGVSIMNNKRFLETKLDVWLRRHYQ